MDDGHQAGKACPDRPRIANATRIALTSSNRLWSTPASSMPTLDAQGLASSVRGAAYGEYRLTGPNCRNPAGVGFFEAQTPSARMLEKPTVPIATRPTRTGSAAAARPRLAPCLPARMVATGLSGRPRRLGGHGAGGYGLCRHRRSAAYDGALHHRSAIDSLCAAWHLAPSGRRPGHRYRPDLRPDRGRNRDAGHRGLQHAHFHPGNIDRRLLPALRRASHGAGWQPSSPRR